MAKLERVFGLTACSSSVSIDRTTGLIAYPAGSTVVVYNPRTLSQANLSAPSSSGSAKNNQLTCLAFSDDGHYICTGEFGAEPKVRVWQLQHDRQTNAKQLAELKYHRLGVTCVAFTKTSNHQLISVGNQHDKSVVVWDWRKGTKLAENRLTSQVNAMDVNESGRMFVTVGVRHVKFWYLELNNSAGNTPVVMLQGRSAILADHRNNTFVDVCCASNNRTFAITVTKLLVEFVDKKLVNIYELGGETPHALTLFHPLLFMGFGNGIVRALNIDSGEVALTLDRPHRLGFDVAAATLFIENEMDENDSGKKYPDVHCMVYHARTQMLTVFYSDRSVYHWQIEALNESEFKGNAKISAQYFHVGPLFDVQILSTAFASSSLITAGTFFTTGADETVRIWNVDFRTSMLNSSGSMVLNSGMAANELQKILYITNSTESLCEQPDKNFGGTLSDALESTTGIRCIRISVSLEHLACGGRDGNIYIFDLNLTFAQKTTNVQNEGKLTELEAHNGEILCLDYSDPTKFFGRNLLASGSRDRLIHIFDASNSYEHLLVIGDHSCSISSIKFIVADNEERRLITCGTDKLIVINQLQFKELEENTEDNFDDDANSREIAIRRLNQISDNFGANFMCATQNGGKLVVACQDRQIRIFSAVNGELLKTVDGASCNEGTLTKLCLDPSETFVASVCSDRFIYIVDLISRECVAALKGQTDCITAIQFSPDCRRLIVVSYNGCIFVWRFSAALIKKMNARLKQFGSTFASSNRCITPDSIIESDSASAVAQKEFPKAPSVNKAGSSNSGSEFGSLTSVNIVQEDDLDSGIGGRTTLRQQQQTSLQPQKGEAAQQRSFEVKRIPIDAIRKSNSNLHRISANQEVKDTGWDVPEQVGTSQIMQFAKSPAPFQAVNNTFYSGATNNNNNNSNGHAAPPNYYQYTQAQQQLLQQQKQQSPLQYLTPNAAVGPATSRSMSNLSQRRAANVSPQRGGASGGRRRWNAMASPVTVTELPKQQSQQLQQTYQPTAVNNGDYSGDSFAQHQYSTPQTNVGQYYATMNNSENVYPPHGVSSLQQAYTLSNNAHHSNNNASSGLSASVSLNALRASAASPSLFGAKFMQQQLQNQTQCAPRGSGGVYYPPSHFTRYSMGSEQTPPQRQNQLGTRAGGEAFERKTSTRNSFSKRYLKNIEEKTLWKPGSTEIRKKRTSSSIFNSNLPQQILQQQLNSNTSNAAVPSESRVDFKGKSKVTADANSSSTNDALNNKQNSSNGAIRCSPSFSSIGNFRRRHVALDEEDSSHRKVMNMNDFVQNQVDTFTPEMASSRLETLATNATNSSPSLNGIDDSGSSMNSTFSPRNAKNGIAHNVGGVLSHRSSSRILSRIKQQRRLTAALLGAAGSKRAVDLTAVAESGHATTPVSFWHGSKLLTGTEGSDLRDLRARSKSPTQLAIQHALQHQQQAALHHHQRESSSGSSRRGSSSGQTSSAVSFISQRRQTDNDASMMSRFSNVRHQSSVLSSPMEAKLNKARAMLKKSQENLTALDALAGVSTPISSHSSTMARSRSIGNLKFSGAAAAAAANFGGTESEESDYFKPNFSYNSSAEENQRTNTLLNGRQMARSVNSLLHDESVDVANDSNSATASLSLLQLQGAKLGGSKSSKVDGGSRLAQSIRDLRKNSNPDLTNDKLYEVNEDEDQFQDESEPYSSIPYLSATLPKNLRRGVQKKLERNNDSSRQRGRSMGAADTLTPSISALSVSGADAEGGEPKISIGSAVNNRYLAYANPARSVSSVEPRTSHHRRTFDSLGGGGAPVPRRTLNYLAQKFSGTDFVAPDMAPSYEDLSPGAKSTRRGSNTSIDFFASVDAEALRTENSKKMAMHTSECVQEMTKACDKLLGARHLILNDVSLATVERETLAASVDRAISTFRQRLDAKNVNGSDDTS